jgi:2-iminobutanoate/2-iminopropanoate deaminase
MSATVKGIVDTRDAPRSAVYSQAVKAGGLVFVSGMVGIDPRTGELAGPSVGEQAAQAIRNCEAILRAAGASLADVVEVQVLLVDPADFAGMNEAYAPFFPVQPPARSVAKLGVALPGVRMSLRMVAAAP